MASRNSDVIQRDLKARTSIRKVVLCALSIFIVGLVWVLWPIYGFLSNQFETARLPWGWQALPNEMPSDEFVTRPAFADAGNDAMQILAKRREEIGAPSLSAAIVIDGELVWAGAVGWSDVAKRTPATIRTSYRIGSTSKPVGITGLARLVAAGTIDLDVPISSYSNDLPNKAWDSFTARQLASHTAGLAGYEENNDWVGFYQSLALTKRYDDPKQALSVFNDSDVLFEPGDNFHYSSFDNVLLSAFIQDAAGQPFNSVMSKYVFDPLELKATLPDYLRDGTQPFARSYQIKGDQVKPWRRVNLSHKLAGGGYVSTPSELARLGAAWLDDDFIPREVRDIFWTPVQLSNGEINEQNYALGFRRAAWPIEGVGDVVHLNHGGVSKGAQCWLMIAPEHELSLAISVNRRTDEFFDFADVYVDLLEVFIPASDSMSK